MPYLSIFSLQHCHITFCERGTFAFFSSSTSTELISYIYAILYISGRDGLAKHMVNWTVGGCARDAFGARRTAARCDTGGRFAQRAVAGAHAGCAGGGWRGGVPPACSQPPAARRARPAPRCFCATGYRLTASPTHACCTAYSTRLPARWQRLQHARRLPHPASDALPASNTTRASRLALLLQGRLRPCRIFCRTFL